MKNSPYKKFTLYMTPELEKLLQAFRDAKQRGDRAYEQAKREPKGGDHFSQENVDWLMSFERAQRAAEAALGAYVAKVYDQLVWSQEDYG